MWILLMIHFHLANNAIAIDHIGGFTTEANCMEVAERIQDKTDSIEGLNKELKLMCMEKK